ncbi:ammonium transporter [Catenisphaera adipataccumulans]|uniref:Amt family ammonium transporter n=1 Tax=Catenisphaera adipataccumulans TaxID=700500 RepID=A0A7W8CXJ6_9FIRM|nr:ammonium transporter [Catenisphaera adipataccumulans]MBB5183448.1 Amt family ammonium transporter [Catenisphaera adipataccumulans]
MQAEILSQVFGIWYLIGAALVFFMQAGFAMVEAGFTRAKNTGNILMKNLMDFCLGTVAFLIVGYSFLMGQDVGGLIGWGENPLFNFAGTDWSSFVFNLVFCATAATIVSGAMAERTKFLSYCIYSFVISLVVYPIEAHWVWGGGFLSQMGFHDFAGSACIHYVGGLTALIGAWMEGPRIGKFNKDGSPNGIPGHNLTAGALGCFILWFGWYGFNGAAAVNSTQLSTIFGTTTVAPAVATVTVMIITWIKYGKPDVGMCLNGSLAGLVAITAGCDAVDMLGAFIIGILAGFTVVFGVWLLDYKLKVDDPVGAVAVHMCNGILGTLCVGLFACGTDTMPQAQGLFYGGGAHLLGVQIIGLLCIGAWTAVTMFISFKLIDKTVGLRVDPEAELVGLDRTEHGLESAYAGFAFNESYTGADTGVMVDTAPEVSMEKAVPTKDESTHTGISKVVIITKPEKLDALKAAMDRIGIMGMTVTQVMGCGVQKGQTTYYRGAKVMMNLLPKLKAEIVVHDVPVELVVNTARKALYTGHMGDGKVFVYDVQNVVRISSGDQGSDALKYNEAK